MKHISAWIFYLQVFVDLLTANHAAKTEVGGKIFSSFFSKLQRILLVLQKILLETLHCSVLPKLDYFFSQIHSQGNKNSIKTMKLLFSSFIVNYFYLTFFLPGILLTLLYHPENNTKSHVSPQTKIWGWTLPRVFVRNIKAHRKLSLICITATKLFSLALSRIGLRLLSLPEPKKETLPNIGKFLSQIMTFNIPNDKEVAEIRPSEVLERNADNHPRNSRTHVR